MKKLDAAYFGIKKKELEMFIWVRGRLTIPTALMSEALHLLEQIARDGFNAGAEAQKVADKNAVAKRADEIGGEYGDVLRDQALAAIQSAIVEFPHE